MPKAKAALHPSIRRDGEVVLLRASVDRDVEDFVRRMEYVHRVSMSAVVETALLLLMEKSDNEVGQVLMQAGAAKRRRK
jgi:hypothetical protein